MKFIEKRFYKRCSYKKWGRNIAFCGIVGVFLSSCNSEQTEQWVGNDNIDTDLKLSRNDYRNMGLDDKKKSKKSIDLKDNKNTEDADKADNVEIKAETKAPPIPEVAPILAAPKPPKLSQTQMVSIAVTDDVPLKDVLMEVARLANIDMELDANISGGVNFRAKDRPFNEVVDRIATMAGLRYSMKGGILRIERDTPFMREYSLDFLNLTRSSTSSVSVATDVSSLAAGGSSGSSSGGSSGGSSSGGSSSSGGGGLSSGSNSSITASSEDDFWESLDGAIDQILSYTPGNSNVVENGEFDADASSKGSKSAGGASAKASGSAVDGNAISGASYVINRKAGVLSVSATQKQHDVINSYLEKLRAGASSQVLIEAKIVEVSLDDKFRSGINWNFLSGKDLGSQNITLPYGLTGDTDFIKSSKDTAGNITNVGLKLGGDLSATVELAERFGTVRTLSSPRLHAINNQQAVLTFVQNYIYFDVQTEHTDPVFDTSTGGTLTPAKDTYTSTKHTVPIGIILNIIPSIDSDRGEVTLNVRPTLSKIINTVDDPGSALANAKLALENAVGFTNKVPVVEVREMDSILKIKSGQIMVIGGLMQQSSANADLGVPGIGEVPFLGNLFKSTQKDNSMKELVIFIKASIVGSNGDYHHADKNVYEKFTKDPRPLEF